MGIMDAFNAEDRITVTVSKFGEMMKAAVKADLMMNAVNCEVPYQYIREMVTGIKKEDPEKETPADRLLNLVCDILEDAVMNGKEDKDEPVCGDSDTEERQRDESREGCESEGGAEDGCDEDHGSEGTGVED